MDMTKQKKNKTVVISCCYLDQCHCRIILILKLGVRKALTWYIYMSKGIKNTNTTKYPNPNCIKNTKSSLWIPKGYPKDIISVHLSLDHGIIILYGCGKVTTSQPSHSQVFVASTLLSWVHLCLNTCTNDWASAGFWRANWRIESLEAIVEAERYICPNVPPPFSSSFSLLKKNNFIIFLSFVGHIAQHYSRCHALSLSNLGTTHIWWWLIE